MKHLPDQKLTISYDSDGYIYRAIFWDFKFFIKYKPFGYLGFRSEERRVGKECGSCSSAGVYKKINVATMSL